MATFTEPVTFATPTGSSIPVYRMMGDQSVSFYNSLTVHEYRVHEYCIQPNHCEVPPPHKTCARVWASAVNRLEPCALGLIEI